MARARKKRVDSLPALAEQLAVLPAVTDDIAFPPVYRLAKPLVDSTWIDCSGSLSERRRQCGGPETTEVPQAI